MRIVRKRPRKANSRIYLLLLSFEGLASKTEEGFTAELSLGIAGGQPQPNCLKSAFAKACRHGRTPTRSRELTRCRACSNSGIVTGASRKRRGYATSHELVFASKILRLHVFQARWYAIMNDCLHGFDFRLLRLARRVDDIAHFLDGPFRWLSKNGGDKRPLRKASERKKMKVPAQKPDLAELVFGNAEIPRNVWVATAGPGGSYIHPDKGCVAQTSGQSVAEGSATRLWNMDKE